MNARLLGHAKRQLYVTVAEAAEVTGDRPDTIRWQLRHGKRKGRRFKSGWRVLASELRKQGR